MSTPTPIEFITKWGSERLGLIAVLTVVPRYHGPMSDESPPVTGCSINLVKFKKEHPKTIPR